MKIKTETWLAWIGAIVVGLLTFASFAFTTFETKDHAQETKGDMKEQLNRIENGMSEIRADLKQLRR